MATVRLLMAAVRLLMVDPVWLMDASSIVFPLHVRGFDPHGAENLTPP